MRSGNESKLPENIVKALEIITEREDLDGAESYCLRELGGDSEAVAWLTLAYIKLTNDQYKSSGVCLGKAFANGNTLTNIVEMVFSLRVELKLHEKTLEK